MWGDRLRRRPILIATDLGRAAVLCLVPLAAAWHVLSMPHLCVVAALAGALTVFFDVAYQSYLPSLVERDRISEGNSKLTLSITGAEIAGPPLTGILVQLLTAPLAILLDAISFVFSAGMVWWIRTPENPPEPRQTKGESMWSETLSGLHFVAASPPLRALALRSVTAYFFFGFLATLYVLYALDVLKLSTAELGFTIAAGGVGGVLGSLFSERVVRRLGLGRTFVITALLHGCAAMLIPMARPPTSFAITLLTAGQLFGDCGFAIYMINETSLRQKMAPPAVLGRVNAAMQLASRGMLPLGALLGELWPTASVSGPYWSSPQPVLSWRRAGCSSRACGNIRTERPGCYNEICLRPITSSASTSERPASVPFCSIIWECSNRASGLNSRIRSALLRMAEWKRIRRCCSSFAKMPSRRCTRICKPKG